MVMVTDEGNFLFFAFFLPLPFPFPAPHFQEHFVLKRKEGKIASICAPLPPTVLAPAHTHFSHPFPPLTSVSSICCRIFVRSSSGR